ncbi:protein DOWN-REGULATED IN DIF1 11-like [Prosopis cineraria]|uniref:protein DOWN-REGULATED IN DIF1 11-like n=1 Tax=Prosopis cineraria TaxID=364024 RepID=UPI00240EE6E9|nr:protein DOWN-REGULATED IN DIF1 11-like [Prosopis cineraria]
MGKHSTHNQVLGSLLVTICIILLSSSSCAVRKTLAAADSPAEGPAERKRSWKGHELPPEPYKGYYDWLGKCGEKLTDKCGQQVVDFLFYKRTLVSYVCCDKLVKMGKKCHRELAKTLARSQDFKNHKAQILRRSKKAWEQCSFIEKCVAKVEE